MARAWVLPLAWFVAMCGSIGGHWSLSGLQVPVRLALVTALAVQVLAVRLHPACRALDPHTCSVGPVPVTALPPRASASGLLRPARRLWGAPRLRRRLNPGPVPPAGALAGARIAGRCRCPDAYTAGQPAGPVPVPGALPSPRTRP